MGVLVKMSDFIKEEWEKHKAKNKPKKEPIKEEPKNDDTKIPKRLLPLNFVIVGKDKRPIQKGWQKKILKSDNPELLNHISRGGNYGVQGNNSIIRIDDKSYFLIVIDFDTKEFMDKVLKEFPETFTTTSGSSKNCCHIWLASDSNKSYKILDEKLKTLCDVQGEGKQIIAPGSTHQEGSIYSVIKDLPFAFMPYAEIKAILTPYDKRPKKVKPVKKQYSPKGIKDDITEKIMNSVSMVEVLDELSIDTSKNPTNCFAHSSDGGKCFGWNDETAHCFHCDGSWNKFSLIREGKGLTNKTTFDWFAKKGGVTEELEESRREYKSQKEQEETKRVKEIIKNSKTDLKELKDSVIQLIALKRTRDATELITQKIEEEYHIFSIRDDEKLEMWIYSEGIYIPQAKTFIKEFCRQVLDKLFTSTFTNEVIVKIEADTYIDAEKFYNNNYVEEVPVLNGVLNIITKELSKFTPDKIFFNKLPVTYDPSKECPNVITHLNTVLKDNSDVPVMQELFGYLLYKRNKVEKAVMMTGTGRNGKSKTLSLMKSLLGVDNCVGIPIQQLEEDKYALSELFSKMANLAGDLSPTALKNERSAFKLATGNDLITASRKWLPRIKFVNYAKMIFCCNELPIAYDTSNAFWNRWILLDFPYTFVSQEELNKIKKESKEGEEEDFNYKLADTEIIDKLTTPDELSGLLNWSLLGLKRLLENGDFSSSKSVNDVKMEWIRKSDSFSAFFMDFIENSWSSDIIKGDLRKTYGLYCRRHKLRNVSDKRLKQVLSDKGIGGDAKVAGEHVWSGIKFKEFDEKGNICQGSQGSQGISTLGNNLIIAISGKRVDKVETLEEKKQKEQEKLGFEVEEEVFLDE